MPPLIDDCIQYVPYGKKENHAYIVIVPPFKKIDKTIPNEG